MRPAMNASASSCSPHWHRATCRRRHHQPESASGLTDQQIPGHDLPRLRMAIAHHQAAAPLVTLADQLGQVCVDLRFQRGGQYPPCLPGRHANVGLHLRSSSDHREGTPGPTGPQVSSISHARPLHPSAHTNLPPEQDRRPPTRTATGRRTGTAWSRRSWSTTRRTTPKPVPVTGPRSPPVGGTAPAYWFLAVRDSPSAGPPTVTTPRRRRVPPCQRGPPWWSNAWHGRTGLPLLSGRTAGCSTSCPPA
jgi:hypothetical protein